MLQRDANLLTFILAGGKGTRLSPLTRDRTKPAVPFAGRFRIIDFVLSNCINSGFRKIYVLTQTKSHSLDRHIQLGWSFLSPDLQEFVSTIPAQQRISENWYQGTADAIYQNLYLINDHCPDNVLILSGDHIYKMDYTELLSHHLDTNADLTVAVKTIKKKDASGFGVLSMGNNNDIASFLEKPKDINLIPGDGDDCYINMGIYLFKTEMLVQVVSEDAVTASDHDFGKNIIPDMLSKYKVKGFIFENSRFGNYWQDVGTIKNFYDSNMDFLKHLSQHEGSTPEWRIRTLGGQNPPSFFGGQNGIVIDNSAIGSGSHLKDCKIYNSIIGRDVWIGNGCVIEDSIINNGSRIGDNCHIKNAILDHKVNVSANNNINADIAADGKQITISDGIVVISKKLTV